MAGRLGASPRWASGRRLLYKVVNVPARQIAVSLHVTVLFLIGSVYVRNAAGDVRFLCNYKQP